MSIKPGNIELSQQLMKYNGDRQAENVRRFGADDRIRINKDRMMINDEFNSGYATDFVAYQPGSLFFCNV